jgi:hypothetical protein
VKKKWLGISLVVILYSGLMSAYVFCDDDYSKGHEDEYHSKAHDGNNNKKLSVVQNQAYLKNCGSCHFAYPPGLLPTGSWDKVMMTGHFGEIDKMLRKEITEYLKANSADNSAWEVSRKILSSLKGDAPEKITDVPYIRKKHRELNKDIFKRPSIRSDANCKACHKKAEQGIYEDDDVVIPVK